MDNKGLYQDKPDNYYSMIRWDIINLIPAGDLVKLLDIGCGNGVTLKKLKELGKSREIYGVELNERMRPQLENR